MKIVNEGNNTEQHRLECEARHMLTLPLTVRRKELEAEILVQWNILKGKKNV